jgi:hypothetical protein
MPLRRPARTTSMDATTHRRRESTELASALVEKCGCLRIPVRQPSLDVAFDDDGRTGIMLSKLLNDLEMIDDDDADDCSFDSGSDDEVHPHQRDQQRAYTNAFSTRL